MPAPPPGIIVNHTNGTVPCTIPTSATDPRHAHTAPTPAARRTRARPHTTSAANGTATNVMSTTPLNVSKQPCHRPATHLGADIISGRRTTNTAPAIPRIARLMSTILLVRLGGADSDALLFTPPLQTEGRCGGVSDFRYARDTDEFRRPGRSTRT
jgi:hypothetical protein